MGLTQYLFGCCTKPTPGQHSRQPSIFPIQPTVTILFVGLDSSGKTSIVDRICQRPFRLTRTSWGFETALAKVPKDKRAKVRLFDIGGHEKIRGIWANYYAEAHAVCFVVDGSNVERLEEARQVLQQVKAAPGVAGKPILILFTHADQVSSVQWPVFEEQFESPTGPTALRWIDATMAKKNGRSSDPALIDAVVSLITSVLQQWEALDARVQLDALAQKAKYEAELQERKTRIANAKDEKHGKDHEESDNAVVKTAVESTPP